VLKEGGKEKKDSPWTFIVGPGESAGRSPPIIKLKSEGAEIRKKKTLVHGPFTKIGHFVES